jgi:hypothetical protein
MRRENEGGKGKEKRNKKGELEESMKEKNSSF